MMQPLDQKAHRTSSVRINSGFITKLKS